LIGYDAAAALAHEAVASGKTVREVAQSKDLLTPEQLDKALDPWSMTMPGRENSSKSARAKLFFFCYKPRDNFIRLRFFHGARATAFLFPWCNRLRCLRIRLRELRATAQSIELN
jgi:Fumarase C C-terminus